MTENTHPNGELYTFKIDKDLPDGFYQYKYVVKFRDFGQGTICSDPCAKLSGEGEFENSAFVIGGNTTVVEPLSNRLPFKDLIIYEMMVDDFTAQFRGNRAPIEAVLDKIDYLQDLGINAIEFMPITAFPGGLFNWGYEPNWFFAVENRYVKNELSPLDRIFKLKSLINELHSRNIHVIFDGVFNHVAAQTSANRGFPYHWLYQNTEDSPFTGKFDEEFPPLMELDFHNKCTQDFILDICKYWLDVFQFDGIRFDFTRGFYQPDNPVGITKLITDLKNYLSSTGRGDIPLMIEHLTDNRFDAINDTNKICATSCWFDEFLHKNFQYMGNGGNIDEDPGKNLRILNAHQDYGVGKGPVIYIDNHDHSTIVNAAGGRNRWFKTQPAAIALLTSPGAVLIRNGQEFGEDYCLPLLHEDSPSHPCGSRVSPRPLRWKEHSTDFIGTRLYDIYKKLIQIRKDHPSLSSPNFFPDNNQNHPDGYGAFPDKDVVIYHRYGYALDGRLERFMIVVNYSDFDQYTDIPFAVNGQWLDLLNGGSVNVTNFRLHNQRINSNWGRIYYKKG